MNADAAAAALLLLQVEVVDGGVMESRRHLNVRGKSATLPAITEKDWLDLKFGVESGVDYFALSFVKVRDMFSSVP
jgi:pyruvate kinase